MATGILSAKGWVVIPQELRERYGLRKGDRVHFIDYGGVVAIVPVSRDPVRDAAGMMRREKPPATPAALTGEDGGDR